MLKKIALFILGAIAATPFVCCNDDPVEYNTEITYSSTLVTGFRLKADKKVLASLDTVFFSIDQTTARIFNADSLPYGTKTDKLLAVITTDNCRSVELTMRNASGNDTVINYLTNSTDTINFANGAVKLKVVSYDGQCERNYLIDVNVHQMVPDSLYWNELYKRKLPSEFTPEGQKTVKSANKAYCLIWNSGECTISSTADPAADTWSKVTPDFQNVDFESFAGTDNALYILTAAGDLLRSADGGATWATTGENWESITGGYGSTLLGIKEVAGGYIHARYPSDESQPETAKASFPISGASNLALVTTKWSDTPQAVIIGGRLADGSMSQSVWGYDGRHWTQLSKTFPKAAEGVALINYDVALVDSISWKIDEMPALITIGGRMTDGTVIADTYISRDMGMSWKKADNLLQLPEYIEPRYSAQPLIFESTLHESRSANALWESFEPVPLSSWWKITKPVSASRATAPITEWNCPYIYLFGGYDANGSLYNSIWKGVINRLTFKPLQ